MQKCKFFHIKYYKNLSACIKAINQFKRTKGLDNNNSKLFFNYPHTPQAFNAFFSLTYEEN